MMPGDQPIDPPGGGGAYEGQEEVEHCWETHWKDLVCNKDGTVDMDQVKKELYDFWQVMDRVPKVYDHVTGNQVSKILTDPDVVCRLADDHYNQVCQDDRADEEAGGVSRIVSMTMTCSVCNGSGSVEVPNPDESDKAACPECNGAGSVSVEEQ